MRCLSPFLAWLLIAFCCLEAISDSARADGIVRTCDQASLEAALAGGGNVGFTCTGVIVLTNTISITANTVLDATGQSVTISGNDSIRLFYVGTNVSFTIVRLTLSHGNDVGAPGDAQTPGGSGYGGALFVDGGVLNATDCQFSSNRASGGAGTFGKNAGGAYGGAIYNRSASLNLTNCTFISNLTAGGGTQPNLGSGRGGAGMGGAIYNDNGTLLAFGTRFFSNAAQGGVLDSVGGYDGGAFGGAVYSTNGTVEFENCILSTNRTVVGPVTRNSVAGAAGGGAIYAEKGSIKLRSSVLTYNECTGDGGWTASEGNGGAIFNNSQLSVSNCLFQNNSAVGATGIGDFSGVFGSKAGNGGAIYNLSSATIVSSTFDGNSATGGRGSGYPNGPSTGADGNGGALYSTDTISLLNCTLFANAAFGGAGAFLGGTPTDGGPGSGGAVYARSGTVTITNLTLAENSAKGGLGSVYPLPPPSPPMKKNDGASQGGALYVAAGAVVTVVNTIVANSLSGSNCFGTLGDAGHNISSDASCNFTAAGSLNNTDPRLGPFGHYGGPTTTVPLLAGSPAIDAGGSAVSPAVDQRGISRPYGAGCDIGAFESAPLFTINGHIRGYSSPEVVRVNVGSNSVPVDASGFYSFTGLIPGTYLVTPSAAETRFVPGDRLVQVGPDSSGIDFTAYRLNALAVETSTNRVFQIVYAGDIEGTYRTEISTNLIDWSLYSTNHTDTNGVFVIADLYPGSGDSRFLRVVKP